MTPIYTGVSHFLLGQNRVLQRDRKVVSRLKISTTSAISQTAIINISYDNLYPSFELAWPYQLRSKPAPIRPEGCQGAALNRDEYDGLYHSRNGYC